jgi:splicing factor 1
LRTNTRENRARDRLIEEKTEIIEELLETHPEFGAPNDYKRPKKTKRIYLPDTAFDPDTNYIGLIIGPKGKT